MSLDFAVSARQDFGSTFHAPTVKKLLAGKLTMTPHAEWALPKTIDWAADPFGDVNWQNQYHMLRWLDPLRRAAAKGDDAAYEMWIRYTRDWVRSNPRSAPAHKWVWRDMVEGIRVIQFCLAAPLVRDRSPEDLVWLEETIRDHADFMSDPANLGKANHAMHQHEALFVCGRILGDQGYTELAVTRFDKLLSEEYDEQGVNGEGAVAYHYNNYLWYERALKRFDAEGVPRPSAAARHALAPEEIAHATRPDGTFVSIGDTDGGTATKVGSPLTDYVTSGGAKGEPPSDLLKVYDRGYLFARSGWGETERNLDEETFFSVSFGAADRVHGHPDGGSLTFSADTVNWVVDPGKFQYGYSIPRKHLVSRASHSLVSIEGMTPRKGATVTLTRQRITDRSYDFLFTDDSFPDISLTRRVVYSVNGDYLVVIDHVRSRKECTAVQRWQLGPEVNAEVSRHRVDLTKGDRHAALIYAGTATSLDQVRGQTNPFDGWVATGWKQKAEATAVNARKSWTNFRFITVLTPGAGGVPAAKTVKTNAPGFCLQVSNRRISEYIVIDRDSVSFPSDPASAASSSRGSQSSVSAPSDSHLNTRIRRETFELLQEVRERARSLSASGREVEATFLAEKAKERGLDGDIDLGFTAMVTDLRQIVRGRVDPKRVEPHRSALMNWDQNPEWRPTFYPMPVNNHGSACEFTLTSTKQQIHTVNAGPLIIPFAVDPAPGKTLTVLFQGAVDRGKVRVPIFLRWRYQLELKAGPTLAIADPTLDLAAGMRLGWYLGTERADLVPVVADIVKRAASDLGADNIVLTGSSGGGFAALQAAAHIPGSTVVAMSPQTDLRDYSPRLVANAISPAFGLRKLGGSGIDESRISVAARVTKQRHYPRVIMVSNPGDRIHVTKHEGPLRKHYQAAGHGSLFTTTEVDLGPGHRSVGNDDYQKIMQSTYGSL